MRARITVGLPVRNGAAHLAEAIESFFAQSFRDFTLVICDNASTDGTRDIALAASSRESRVTLIRHRENIGAVRNFIFAAEQSRTEYFCWAAHDDRRHPEFLQKLLDQLESHPTAALACCDVRDIDPDGSPGEVRADTAALRTTCGMTSVERIRTYLKHAPGTPFYGLFRRQALQEPLEMLRRAVRAQDPPQLGLDVAFLAHVLNRHDMAVVHEPLLLFRRGGFSHRVDAYDSLWSYATDVRRFARALADATRDPGRSPLDRARMAIARRRYMMRYSCSAPSRRIIGHHLCRLVPHAHQLQCWWMLRSNPAFRRLRTRACGLPPSSRVVIFGSGKHTRRCLGAIRMAFHPSATVVAICDDAPQNAGSFGQIPVIGPHQIAVFKPTLVVASSDTYESKLHARATEIAPAGTPVWSIYDAALEVQDSACSSASMEEMKASIDSIASKSADPIDDEREDDLIASTNAMRR